MRPALVIRVYTEGRKTEPSYLAHWARERRGAVAIEIDDFHGTPMAIARRAANDMKLERRRGIRHREHDEVWCVFDCDDHPDVPQTVALLRDHGIGIAFSNPCFELWILLHAADQRAYIDRRGVQALAREAGLTDGKGFPDGAWRRLVAGQPTATARAIELERWHKGNGSPPDENPSSSVWRLVDRILDGRALPMPDGG